MATPLPTSPSSMAQAQLSGSNSLLNTGQADLGQQIALVPMTGGLSLLPQALGMTWGSGKSHDQQRRDVVRKALQGAGFLDPNFLATMANGKTFDFGSERTPEGNKITQYDPNDKIHQLAIGMANPLMEAAFKGNPNGQENQWAAMMANAASEGAKTPEEMRQNMMAMAQKMGFTQQGLTSALDSLNKANPDPNNAAYDVGVKSIFDPNTLSAIKPVGPSDTTAPTAHGEPPGPTTPPINGVPPQQTPVNQNVHSNLPNAGAAANAGSIIGPVSANLPHLRSAAIPGAPTVGGNAATPSAQAQAVSQIGQILPSVLYNPLANSTLGTQPNDTTGTTSAQQGILPQNQNGQIQNQPLYRNNTLGGMSQGLPQNRVTPPAQGMMALAQQQSNPTALANGQTQSSGINAAFLNPTNMVLQAQGGALSPQDANSGLLSLLSGSY